MTASSREHAQRLIYLDPNSYLYLRDMSPLEGFSFNYYRDVTGEFHVTMSWLTLFVCFCVSAFIYTYRNIENMHI